MNESPLTDTLILKIKNLYPLSWANLSRCAIDEVTPQSVKTLLEKNSEKHITNTSIKDIHQITYLAKWYKKKYIINLIDENTVCSLYNNTLLDLPINIINGYELNCNAILTLFKHQGRCEEIITSTTKNGNILIIEIMKLRPGGMNKIMRVQLNKDSFRTSFDKSVSDNIKLLSNNTNPETDGFTKKIISEESHIFSTAIFSLLFFNKTCQKKEDKKNIYIITRKILKYFLCHLNI
jgi:hypothetical protein